MVRGIDTRDRIRKVAIDLFASQGYEKTSLREIADRLGFTKAALYYHFSSKRELAEAILAPMMQDVDAVLAESQRDQLMPRDFFACIFDAYVRHLPVFTLMLRDGSIMGALDLGSWSMNWLEKAVQFLVRDDTSVERRIRAVASLAVLRGTVVLAEALPVELVRSTLTAAACDALGAD